MRGVKRWRLKLRWENDELVFRANSLRNVEGLPGTVEYPFEVFLVDESETQAHFFNIQMFGSGAWSRV